MRTGRQARTASSGRFDGGKCPRAIENLGSRAVQPGDVVPAGRDWKAVLAVVATAAKMDGDRTVGVGCRGDVVDAVGVFIVLLEEACGVVDRDGPEAVNRHISHCEFVLA